MSLSLFLLIIATIAAAYRMRRRPPRTTVIEFDQMPDVPKAFGYKMSWLAIRTREADRVVDALGLIEPRAANWESGLGTIYDDRLGETHVFVTPPIDGWTLVAGLSIPHPMSASFVDKCTPLLTSLGARFIEVQYFFSYPLIDLYAWARVRNGQIERGFGICDEGVLWNVGRTTREERTLGLRLFEVRGPRERHGDVGGGMVLYPTEAHVLQLAGRWSIDPSVLDRREQLSASLGVVASAPATWRVERARRVA